MSQILGIKFSDHGPVCYFSSGDLLVRPGQSVLLDTDQGLALGRVALVREPEAGVHGAAAAAADQPLAVVAGGQAAAPQGDDEPAPFDQGFGGAEWDEVLVADGPDGNAPAQAAPDSFEEPEPPQAPPKTAEHATLFSSDQGAPVCVPKAAAGLQPVLRLASEADLDAHAENRRLAKRAFAFCRGSISAQNLDMKLVDVEVLHDKSKLIFFFTAPNRIDFRELIKSLVREFHTRIELRQIGVRHETQMIGAIGNCGQVCCCRRFLRKFAPVTIKMAKEQNLFLNPAKISGICGRLLCCLSYEQKGYEEFHKQCPKIGKRVQTPIGSVKVLRANFFKKSISVWLEDAGEREFTLDEWRELLNRQPGDPLPQSAQPEAQGRGARGGRVSTGRPARSDRPDRSDRPERAARPERSERPERPERSDRPDRPEGQARPDRPERRDRPDRQERPDKPERPDRPERQDRAPESPAGQAAQNAEAGAQAGGEQGDERQKPRRRRRRRGPKPA